MNGNDKTSDMIEDFLGRIRIGDVPDIDEFIAGYQATDDVGELRSLLMTLLDVERLTIPSESGGDEPPPPDLSSCGYRLLKKIGVGGMGVVYEALQVNLGRHVAIKLLRPELLSDPEIRELFRLEARILARFDHPGIVRILGDGQCGDAFFYVMELVDGRHLDALSGRPGDEKILQWAAESADALACAHSHGIVHGDIKPANLLLDKSGHIRICDFGLAFVSRSFEDGRARHGGTPRYMAPEVKQGGLKSFAGDQYALCASLVEISAAEPFDRGRRPSVRGQRLATVLAKGLDPDPKNRYPSVCELRDDLRRIVRNEPIVAGYTPPTVRLRLFCRRHPIGVVAAAMLTLCLGAVIHGLIRTESALRLARLNAATANAAIGKVFDEMVELPPAQESTDLLTQLIPYYEQIAVNPNIPESELIGALTQLAQTALRTGDYPLAERTLRRLLDFGESSDTLCRLADALLGQGKRDESIAIYRKLIARYSNGTRRERLNVARAHLYFAQSGTDADESAHRRDLLRILSGHLTSAPGDDRALFLYAQLIGIDPEAAKRPIAGVPADQLEILDEISTRNPNNSSYWRAFIGAAIKWLENADSAETCPPTIASALDKGDIMLWRFMRNPNTVSLVISLKRAYSRWIRLADAGHDAVHGPRSIDILTQTLLNIPDLPSPDQSDLIAASLDVIEERLLIDMSRGRKPSLLQRRLSELKGFLSTHNPPRKNEFLRRIREIEPLVEY